MLTRPKGGFLLVCQLQKRGVFVICKTRTKTIVSMDKKTVITGIVVMVVTLALANRLRMLPVIKMIPTV